MAFCGGLSRVVWAYGRSVVCGIWCVMVGGGKGGGAHWPLTTLCPSSSSLPYLSLSTSLSFPLVGCANEALDFPCFTALCRVHRGGQLSSPLATCVQAVIPNRRVWTPPQRRLLGPGMSTCGVFSPTGAHNNLLFVHSRAQSSLW